MGAELLPVHTAPALPVLPILAHTHPTTEGRDPLNAWTIHLTHGRGEIDCDADELTVRDGGALWMLAETGPRSACKLVPLLVLAAGSWWAVHSADLALELGDPEEPAPRERLQVLPGLDDPGDESTKPPTTPPPKPALWSGNSALRATPSPARHPDTGHGPFVAHRKIQGQHGASGTSGAGVARRTAVTADDPRHRP